MKLLINNKKLYVMALYRTITLFPLSIKEIGRMDVLIYVMAAIRRPNKLIMKGELA